MSWTTANVQLEDDDWCEATATRSGFVYVTFAHNLTVCGEADVVIEKLSDALSQCQESLDSPEEGDRL
jgi:hypothetical protein